ncbi:MAG: DUF58 domain-containing protein [Planctomycetota bacterium]|nr:DUF58 domain-containing protein [Planctomycetota bacterium]
MTKIIRRLSDTPTSMASKVTSEFPHPGRSGIFRTVNNLLHGRLGNSQPRDGTTYIFRRPSIDLSLTGAIYSAMMLFMGLAAANSQANLLFGLFGIMIGILITSNFLCRLVLSRLRVSRILPDHAFVGGSATIQYRFQNAKRFWPSLSVSLSELDGSEAFMRQPHAYLLHSAAGTTVQVPIEVYPKRRGLHKLSKFQLSTSFPFGFIHRAIARRQEDSILIYPAAAEVSPNLIALCRSAERGGADMRPRANGNDEFYGVKEFRAGQNPRQIYWKRSARTGTLIAKEMAQISPPQLLLLVDTFLADDQSQSRASMERTIAMAGSLARQALENGMAVGLVIWNNGWTKMGPQRGKRHAHDLLAILATAPINRAARSDQLVAQGMLLMRQAMTAVLLSPRSQHSSRYKQTRGGFLVIAADSAQAQSWFQFKTEIDFTSCGPLESQARKGVKPGRAEKSVLVNHARAVQNVS